MLHDALTHLTNMGQRTPRHVDASQQTSRYKRPLQQSESVTGHISKHASAYVDGRLGAPMRFEAQVRNHRYMSH